MTFLIFINLLFVLHMSMALLLSRQKSHIKIQTTQNIKVSWCLWFTMQSLQTTQTIYNSSVFENRKHWTLEKCANTWGSSLTTLLYVYNIDQHQIIPHVLSIYIYFLFFFFLTKFWCKSHKPTCRYKMLGRV